MPIFASPLKDALDALYLRYDAAFLEMDPLALVTRYVDSRDQEVAGFIAAVLALGRWEQIKKVVSAMLEIMGPSPFGFVSTYDPHVQGNPFSHLKHRFYRGDDLGLLVFWLAQIIRRSGSVEAFFLAGDDPADPTVGTALSRFVQAVRHLESRPFYDALPLPGRGASHFLTDPARGSAAKRLCLYLRWMVRRDNLDLGLWTRIDPARLVIPLDVHITRMGRRLGLTRRSTPGWAMALEITEALRRLDSADPVKYDFALCTLGKIDPCKQPAGCGNCPIGSGCGEFTLS